MTHPPACPLPAPRPRMLALLLFVVAAAQLTGCGASDADNGSATAAAGDAFGLPDGLFSDVGAKPGGAKDATNSPADVAAKEQCEFDDHPSPGEPGASCATAVDCDSGYCIHTANGKVCTRTCVDCCPAGFSCQQANKTDTVFLCIATQQAVCRPCLTDDECGAISAGALCVPFGPNGSFCGGTCDATSDCPDGYACELREGEKGEAKQCVRSDGQCTCSPAAVAEGATTQCVVSNSEGACAGTRKCTSDGLTACDAPTAATEICDDLDNDCDGVTDEGCDLDGDGYCASGVTVVGLPAACSEGSGDCDDEDATVSPAVTESCDGIDNDCDSAIDEADALGCSPWFSDSDQDGFGAGASTCLCAATGLYNSATNTDCDDGDNAVFPGSVEQCNNGKDDDCDGVQNETGATGCSDFYIDADLDGFGTGAPSCLCAADKIYVTAKPGDCADTDIKAHPAATELCNGKDDDCNGSTDEQDAFGCSKHYVDADKDGYGLAEKHACLCQPSVDYPAIAAGDCDDVNLAVSPTAIEACNNIDDDCDGQSDEANATGCKPHFADGDGDGFGDAGKQACLCKPTSAFSVTKAKDCKDNDKTINPDAKESCNTVDDDCDGTTDEANAGGCKPYFKDGDGDGFGDVNDAICLCAASLPYTATAPGDCNDKAKPVNPKAKEKCDGIDNNCDGATDEQGAVGCLNYYVDQDGDKLGDGAIAPRCLCAPQSPYGAAKAGDCNDNDKTIWLNAPEQCDKKDNDCDGVTDEPGATDCKDFYFDGDGDGWGLQSAKQCACAPIGPYKALKKHDCGDNNKAINPSEAEQCDGLDNDCNGKTDDDVGNTEFFEDKDGDGWGVGAAKKMCKPSGTFKATKSGDCDDNDSGRYPNNAEVCDGKDNNCNKLVDEGGVAKSTFFRDSDGDGYGVTGDSKLLCLPDAPYTATKGGDCADGNKLVHPGAAEIQCNKIDDDCKGGDACNSCGASKCGGKCGSALSAGVEYKITCITVVGVQICYPPVAFNCYCDANCLAFGDCCQGYATCCK